MKIKLWDSIGGSHSLTILHITIFYNIIILSGQIQVFSNSPDHYHNLFIFLKNFNC